MRQTLTVHPELPASRQVVTLGAEQYTLRLTWRDRTAGWYADLWTAAGVPVWLGQRVTTQWGLGLGLTGVDAPDGILFVRGPAEFERADLGGSVRIVFWPSADLPARTSTDLGLTISIP